MFEKYTLLEIERNNEQRHNINSEESQNLMSKLDSDRTFDGTFNRLLSLKTIVRGLADYGSGIDQAVEQYTLLSRDGDSENA